MLIRRKEIEAMPYGSPSQNAAADVWYLRLLRFCLRHEEGYELRRKVLFHEVWYMANQRQIVWLAENRVAAFEARDQ